MIVGVPREIFPGERRVALVPAVLPSLAKAGLEVIYIPYDKLLEMDQINGDIPRPTWRW
jgi:hypothetical protein